MANEYDKILRETFKCPKYNLLRELLKTEMKSIHPLPTKVQQTIIEREADTVLNIEPVSGDPFILHLEWQSTNDKNMAFRMAKYDLLLTESYHKQVMGMVIYVGEKPLTMEGNYRSFGHHYSCPIIDIRNISSDVFLSSHDPGELLLAILAENGGNRQVIQEILTKLRILTKGDNAVFKEKLKHLELISQLRGKELQNEIVKEEERMPITIDIKKDLRFQQGMKQGVVLGAEQGALKNAKENALKMLQMNMSISVVKEVTGLSVAQIKELQNQIKA